MTQGRRITIERRTVFSSSTRPVRSLFGQKQSRTFVLVAPPFPELGDLVTWEGQEWTVKSSELTEVVLICPRSIKAQVEIPGGPPDAT